MLRKNVKQQFIYNLHSKSSMKRIMSLKNYFILYNITWHHNITTSLLKASYNLFLRCNWHLSHETPLIQQERRASGEQIYDINEGWSYDNSNSTPKWQPPTVNILHVSQEISFNGINSDKIDSTLATCFHTKIFKIQFGKENLLLLHLIFTRSWYDCVHTRHWDRQWEFFMSWIFAERKSAR